MTYLELVQTAIRQSGAHLRIPETLDGLDGLQALFKDWVSEAWKEIQIERSEWQFRQDEDSVTLDPVTLDDSVIVPPDQISIEFQRDWRLITLRDLYINDPNDEDFVPLKVRYVSWNRWPDVFGRVTSRRQLNEDSQVERVPVWYTVAPDGNMHVYPRPDKVYEIQFFAPKAVHYLEVDIDEPFIAEEYQMGIVYRALMEYGLYHDDRSVFERARNKWRSYKKVLEKIYMPDMNLRTDQLYRDL